MDRECHVSLQKKDKMKKIFFIAEAGVNHNNQIKLAFKLINAAKNAGADAIKFQVFKTENYVARNAPLANYQKKNTKQVNQFKLIKNLELSENFLEKIIRYCKSRKILFLASAFDTWGIKFLKKRNITTFKIPSGEINNLFYLKEVSKFAKKIILSTGMSNEKEINNALNFFYKNGINKKQITLLQCTTEYPAPYSDLNLNVIKRFKKKFKVKVGFSDHSIGEVASIIAVSMGASIIEKHLTLSRKLPGPDHKASIEPKELKKLIKNIRIAQLSLGHEIKKPTKSELKNIKIARKSIYAKKKILKGDLFTKKNICKKSPANGISANKYFKVLGRKAKKNFIEDEKIRL